MAYPNAHYSPDWMERQDYHEAERQKAVAEATRLAEAGEISSAAYKDATAREDRHLKGYQDAFRQRYPTVQEYATWLSTNFDPTKSLSGEPIPALAFDIESFRTIEEAEAAWERIHDHVRTAEIEARGAMKVGQPPNLLAFADSSRVASYWRQFTREDLHPQGYVQEGFFVSALVTVDVLDDGWHVCFMQDPSHTSPSVVNEFERLATAVFREAKRIADQQQPSNLLARISRFWRTQPAPTMPTPDRFHFYEHLPAATGRGHIPETFERVALAFDGKAYKNPQWRSPRYETIPAALRHAPVNCAKTSAAGQAPRALPGPAR